MSRFASGSLKPSVLLFCNFLLLLFFFWITESGNIVYECRVLLKYQHNYIKPLFYLFNFLVAIFALSAFMSSQKGWRLLIGLVWIFMTFSINHIYTQLNNVGFEYEDLLLIKQNIHFGYEETIFSTYGQVVFPTIIAVGFLFLLICLVQRFLRTKLSSIFVYGLLMLSLLMSYLIIDYSNAQRSAMPSFVKTPSMLIYDILNPVYTGQREAPLFDISEPSSFDHIIWIVDESVRGDHLQLNNERLKTTPFLNSILDESIINFGVANSAAVCSDYSHAVLMTGAKFEDLPDEEDKILSSPTIFQYAKHAGFEPALIYSPGYEDSPKSYLSKYDFETIKTRYNTKLLNPELTYEVWDFKSLDYLNDIFDSHDRSFTYFLKYGAHFHYDDSYPAEEKHFTPIIGFRNFDDVDSVQLINSYHNAIRWTVDHFFKELIGKVGDHNILIIYTSDHGQNLTEYPEIKLTHCKRKDAPNVMANVPLFLYSTNELELERLRSIGVPNANKSHFNVFSSTLEFMGYDKGHVCENYNIGLFEKQDSSFYTSGDIFGRSKMQTYLFTK